MILILSGYDAASHRRWRLELARRLDSEGYTVETHALPPRHFRWRIRGNALEFANREGIWDRSWDLVIATSAVDTAALRGLVRTDCPWIVYVHENQFAYPLRSGQRKRDGSLLIRDLYSALAGDFVVFNSEFNRRSFLDGAVDFVASMPDFNTFEPERLSSKSRVIPVGLEDDIFVDEFATRDDPPIILWNHRWEWDKAPETFFRALEILVERQVDFGLNVVGQQFRGAPEVFAEAKEQFAEHIVRWGYQETREDYVAALDESSVVVSTSLHEYQGIAVMEAVARGCVPVLPDRLAYPNFYPDAYLYESHAGETATEAPVMAATLERVLSTVHEVPSVERYAWSQLWPEWRRLLESAISGG